MKGKRFSLLRFTVIFVIAAAVAAFILLVALPNQQAWQYASVLSDALKDARSVTLVEFSHEFFGPELVFSRTPASPSQIAGLRSATGAWFAPIPKWHMLCFSPHHRVEIVRADGSTFHFDVCFQCRNFKLDGQRIETLPASWHASLERFFVAAGVPPREDYSDLIKKHPDYHLLEEVQNRLDNLIDTPSEPPGK